ncbi:site-2 protease family protein [Dermacoccaceae bacterium W4C1]
MAAAERTDADPGVRGLRVGALRGVPIYLGASWPVAALIIVFLFGPPLSQARPELGVGAYLVAAGYALLLLISVLVHEAAHALMGQARGYRVERIVADVWGGHTAYGSTDTSPGSSAVVAIVGPLANAVLALAAWLALPATPDGVPSLVVAALAWSNALVAAFNLIPALPLDGGFILEAGLWKATGNKDRGTIIASWCGRVLAVLLVAFVLIRPLLTGGRASITSLGFAVLIASFLWMGATASLRGAQARTMVGRVHIRQVLEPVHVLDGSATIAALAPLQPAWVVLTDDQGAWGLVDPQALQAVPPEVRAQTSLATVARRQQPGWVVQVADVDADVTALVQAVQEHDLEVLLALTPNGPGLVRVAALGAALTQA